MINLVCSGIKRNGFNYIITYGDNAETYALNAEVIVTRNESSGRRGLYNFKEADTEDLQMNIQIFGTKKCNDTKKAERFFKERGIKYQFIDMKEKGMSKGEFTSVAQVNGGMENMVNWEGKDQDMLALIKYIAEEDKLEKILANPQVIRTPVVRNGKQSTIGYQPDVWKGWK